MHGATLLSRGVQKMPSAEAEELHVSTGVLEAGLTQPRAGAVQERPPEAISEREMLARLRRRDPHAFELLVRRHQDRVYDFCVRMLGDREEAHDLVQEIFVSVHQSVGSFRMDAKLTTWILRIAKNHCINRLKYLDRRGRGRTDEYGEALEADLESAVGSSPRPDEALHLAQERALVRRAIARLDVDQRTLVVLRDIEQLSYEEIVEITDLPEGTVKSRLHRAREKLAEIIAVLDE
jgi:RNA polymerase sigma-70 factor, ECF subfamily